MSVPLELLWGALDTLAREFPTLPIVVYGPQEDQPVREDSEAAAAWIEPTAEFQAPS